ncbi:MAG: phospho-sugar mutase, partial [Tissierellia bacterium]|nr:phospho-sugar mutase [Tissierellia bacterium]
MNWKDLYKYWIENDDFDEGLKKQLFDMSLKEIEDSFYKYIDFGTGGIRGVLGPGTNRLNKYIIRRANWGYAEYLNFHVENAAEKGVV